MADMSYGAAAPEQAAFKAANVVNLVGGVLSVALLGGIGVWGYELVMRDVTGVPVVRAMEGPMREAPADPGGELARHRGLSVNTIPAVGQAAPPEDRLVLAPRGVTVSREDLEVEPVLASAAAADVVRVAAASPGEAGADDVAATAEDALARQVASGGRDPQAPAVDADAPGVAALGPAVELTGAASPEQGFDTAAPEPEPAVAVLPRSVPGLARSLRPYSRPADLTVIRAAAPAPAAPSAAAAAPAMLDHADIPAGTSLVQLGAYASAEVAGAEWSRIAGRFADFMADKAPVVQRAETGGRIFYRLRAAGFDDLADARRFCAALVAEDADCIPLVLR